MRSFFQNLHRRFRRFFLRSRPQQPEEHPIDFDVEGILSVDIRRLRKGDIVTVSTVNSVYRIQVDDPLPPTVTVWGGTTFFVERQTVSFNGSLIGSRGSMIMTGKILRGHSLEFGLGRKKITTTSVILGIAVNGMIPLPDDVDVVH